jgi:hypothetical protein
MAMCEADARRVRAQQFTTVVLTFHAVLAGAADMCTLSQPLGRSLLFMVRGWCLCRATPRLIAPYDTVPVSSNILSVSMRPTSSGTGAVW